jgi:glycosyltransferase involved in cell wall biosynthesis
VKQSLTILLPVQNAQAALLGHVGRILEIVPELTTRFEIIIVDDGSTDATNEVAHDLELHYPQIRLLRHATPQGTARAIETGLARAQGETVLAYDRAIPLDAQDIVALWRPRRKRLSPANATTANATSERHSATWLNRLLRSRRVERSRCTAATARRPSFQILRRPAIDQLRRTVHRVGQLEWQRSLEPHDKTPVAATNLPILQDEVQSNRSPGPKRPNFLAHLKAFTLGE